MKIVEALFVLDHKEYEQERTKPNHKTGNVDNGSAFVTGEISEGGLDIVL
jgi:hypothetical protein